MFDRTPALRVPMIAMVGNRALDDPGAFGVEHNDALAVRDLGWMLTWVDSAQEALDTALIAYRVAEDRRMFVPCAISCDGAFLTHSQALVQIPTSQQVKSFLPPYDRGDLLLHPDNVFRWPHRLTKIGSWRFDGRTTQSLKSRAT